MGDIVPEAHERYLWELIEVLEGIEKLARAEDDFSNWDFSSDLLKAANIMHEWPVYEEKQSASVVRTTDGLAWRGKTYYEHRVWVPIDCGGPMDILLPFAVLSAMIGSGHKVQRIKTLRPPKGFWSIEQLQSYIKGLRDKYQLTPLTETA